MVSKMNTKPCAFCGKPFKAEEFEFSVDEKGNQERKHKREYCTFVSPI